MHYRKFETPENFRFAPLDVELTLTDCGDGVFHARANSARWPRGSDSIADLDASSFSGRPSRATCSLAASGALLLELDGEKLLEPKRGFGVSGTKWIFDFIHDPETRFYGMGGKNLGFELSGKRTRFWNSDLFAEFEPSAINESRADPLYASFPVLIGKKRCAKPGGLWWALVVDAPDGPFIDAGAGEGIFDAGAIPFDPSLHLGALDGRPELWLLAAESPALLLRKLQTLLGRMELPPIWALGHHQSRWGYRSYDDLDRIAREFEKRGIPNDGLWLDIDYMDGFRVFTVDTKHWDNLEERLRDLAARGFRVVPILDPGLRRDEAYFAFREAREKGLLCVGPEGGPYIGFVWPGYSGFPDFSLPEARELWASWVEALAKAGFAGFWIDMNDPSTGSAPLDDMLFSRGRLPHGAWHNQYALGMAQATKEGLQRARPHERPFLVSRSAWLSQARHSAMWTGDNVSNSKHLAATLPFSLNLSISGMPWNGPDVPGFAGNADSSLMRAWYKAGFLLPFFRNHNIAGAVDQEPWSRGARTTGVVAEYIRSRYRLMPYLYQVFAECAERGDPVMRPLWYEFPEEEWTEGASDSFMLGSSILHAPLLNPKARSRRLRLPRGRWLDWMSGSFFEGDSEPEPRPGFRGTPLYFRSPSTIPLRAGVIVDNLLDLRRVDFLVVLEENDTCEYMYRSDDGISTAWSKGERTVLQLRARMRKGRVEVEIARTGHAGYGDVRARVLVMSASSASELSINGQKQPSLRETLSMAGRRNRVFASGQVIIA